MVRSRSDYQPFTPVIDGLGIYAVDLDSRIRPMLFAPRYSSGVVVTARSPGLNSYNRAWRPNAIHRDQAGLLKLNRSAGDSET